MEMEAAEVDRVLRVFEASLSQIKWRLKSSSKSRLQTDILALCSRLRPCIMVDYGGKMPELGDRLRAFLGHCRKESSIFELLQVMVIDDMVYLIHVTALADFVESSLCMGTAMLFVDLENDPPKMMQYTDKTPAITQLQSAQKRFSSAFHADEIIRNILQTQETCTTSSSESPKSVDLSCCLQESHVTIPTLNGWLLGYPVIYLFGTDYIEHAICNLSTKSLHIYQIFVNRIDASGRRCQKEELTSFTVPYELSPEGSKEPWAESFLAEMRGKWDKCKHVWESLNMELEVGSEGSLKSAT